MSAIKPPGQRINRVTKSIGALSAPGTPPPMPRGLHEQARAAWRAYFSDTASGVVRGCDATIALRWVRNLSRYYTLIEAADAEPVTAGPNGPRANPLYDTALKIETSIENCEKQLMIGALNRLRGGVRLAEDVKSLQELSAEVDDDAEEDPRVVVLARRRPRTRKRAATDPAPL
jgi:hypothetical protein